MILSRLRRSFFIGRSLSNSTFVSTHYKISESDVQDYLQRKAIVLQTSATHFIVKECMLCEKPTANKFDNFNKLYINKADGAFFCHRCGSKGSWFDFKRRLGDIKGNISTNNSNMLSKSDLPVSDTRPRPKLEDAGFASKKLLLDNQYPEVLEYLTGTGVGQRHLKLEILKKYAIGCKYYNFINKNGEATSELCIIFPWMSVSFEGVTTLHRIKARAVIGKHMQKLDPVGGEWGLFGWHTVPSNAKSIILTEGEYDAMAVHQATGLPAVSVPNGCRSLPVDVLPYLEKMDKIYLWMDDDVPGQEGAEAFANKLGVNRCMIVRPPPGCGAKDANEMLVKGIPMRPCIEAARPIPHKQIMSFVELKNEIQLELLNPFQVAGVQSQSLLGLNKLLKGHRKGELTIVTGPTGAGKTTFLSQLSIDYARQGVSTLWGSFEIKNTRLLKKMLSQFSGINIEKDMQHFEAISDQFSQMPMYFLKFFGSTDVDQVLDAMDYAVYVYDVKHIILDNLQFMMGSGSSTKGFERFDAQEKALDKFRKFASNKNVHLTLVVHPRKENEDSPLQISSVFGTAKATQEADNVLILQKVNGKKYIEVKKNRFDGEIGEIEVEFNKETSSYIEVHSDGAEKRRDWKEQPKVSFRAPISVASYGFPGAPGGIFTNSNIKKDNETIIEEEGSDEDKLDRGILTC